MPAGIACAYGIGVPAHGVDDDECYNAREHHYLEVVHLWCRCQWDGAVYAVCVCVENRGVADLNASINRAA